MRPDTGSAPRPGPARQVARVRPGLPEGHHRSGIGWQVLSFAAVCLFLIGLPLSWIAGNLVARFGYPEVRAQIIASHVLVHYDRNAKPRFIPGIRYRFERGGHTAEATGFRFGGAASYQRQQADAMLAPYPIGSYVTARVNPMLPRRAWLEVPILLWPYGLLLLEVGAVGSLLRALARASARGRQAATRRTSHLEDQ
jgi:hypothetical protein